MEAEVRIESPDPEATVEGLHWLQYPHGLPFSHYMAGSVETDLRL